MTHHNKSTSIPLPSGLLFDFLNPDPSMIDSNDIAMGLAKECRFGGFCDGFYSVAQHSTIGAMHVDEQFALEFLLHDAAEAYCGDVMTPFKRVLPDYTTVEGRVDAAIRRKFGLPPEMSPEVKVMDTCLYYTERRDLTPWAEKMIGKFGLPDAPGFPLKNVKVTPVAWEIAQDEFLRIFRFLTMTER
jgi:uncharacterized protein